MHNTKKKKSMKHNYTSELELKSLLIRIKNYRQDVGTYKNNNKIKKYIKLHATINAKKYEFPAKRNLVKNRIKQRIIELSEKTRSDKDSYERFGSVILLMIQKILTKPQFSGYTYKDDFYSDAVYKILKYLCNFNHKLISKRTGALVNSFAYISQIIHNSILYILNTKKKELNMMKRQIQIKQLDHNLQLKNYELIDESAYNPNSFNEYIPIKETIELKTIDINLKHEIENLKDDIDRVDELIVKYPADYRISFDEYNDIKDLLKGKVSIIRSKTQEELDALVEDE